LIDEFTPAREYREYGAAQARRARGDARFTPCRRFLSLLPLDA